jgi:glycosyltransferase involved in cell wall biosynthesis
MLLCYLRGNRSESGRPRASGVLFPRNPRADQSEKRIVRVSLDMHILFDATVMQQPFTGVAKTTLGLYAACLQLAPSMRIEALHRQPLAGKLPEGVRDAQRGEQLPGRFWRPLVLPLAAIAKRPTALHFPWSGNVPRLWGATAVVTTLHDVLPLRIPGYFSSEQGRRAYLDEKQRDIDRTHLLITDSEYSKREIIKYFTVLREPLVLYYGSTFAWQHLPATKGERKGDYFLYVGGYDRRKGLEALLQVFLSLHRQDKLVSKLVLTGAKSYFSEDFKTLMAEGLALDIVEERGYVSDAALYELLYHARALVYPSKYEGFGLPPLEAMAAGCPVITTRCTSLPEICGEAAYYIEPDDESNFAQGLLALEGDSELRRALRVKGREQAAKFSWEKAAATYLTALEETLARKAHRAT